MSNDEQAVAEQVDEEARGLEQVTSDEAGVDAAPLRPLGIPYADADVTDESVAERARREEPEVWERERRGEPSAADLGDDGSAHDPVIVDSDLLERLDEDGDLEEPDDA